MLCQGNIGGIVPALRILWATDGMKSPKGFVLPLSRSEAFRTRAVYRWIVGHIRAADVDEDRFPARPAYRTLDGRHVNEGYSPEQTLLRGYTTCEGFALLFEALATEMNLEVKYLAGTSGWYGDYGHAWNAVRVGGKWEMVDATWGTVPVQRERWYFTPRAEFLKTHVPDDEFMAAECCRDMALNPHILAELRRKLSIRPERRRRN